MPNIDPPQIVKLLAEAPFFEHVPYLDPNEAVILHFKNHPKCLQYQAFQYKKEGLTALNEMKPFNDSPYESAFLGENDLSIPLSDIPEGEVLSCWKDANAQEIQFLPIVLLSGPVAAILIPRPHQEEHLTDLYQQYLPMLGGIASECCLKAISETMPPVTPDETVEDLLYFYAKALVEWLFPYQFSIMKNDSEQLVREQIYNGKISTHKDWFELKLHLDKNIYKLQFEIPSLRYPIKGQPDWWHEVGHFKLRKFKYQMLFVTLFNIIYKLRKTTQTNHLITQDRLREVESLLNQIKADLVRSTPGRAVPKMPEQRKLNDFCFFRDKNNWVIQFMGQPIRPKIKSPQGMESIRLLLENSPRRLPPSELYDLLEKGEFTYGKSKRKQQKTLSEEEKSAGQELTGQEGVGTGDLVWDEVLIDELKNTYQVVLDSEEKMEGSSQREQITYWKIRLDTIKGLLKFFPKSSQYLNDYGRCRSEINKRSVLEDENFTTPFTSIHQVSEPRRDEKNKRDSIRSGINSALNSFEEYEDFHLYLKQTLILIFKGSEKPFQHLSERSNTPDLRTITWQTEP